MQTQTALGGEIDLPKWLHPFRVPPATHDGSNFSAFLATLVTVHPFFPHSHPSEYEVLLYCGFDLLSPTNDESLNMANDAEHCFT